MSCPSRLRVSDELYARLQRGLTARDRSICKLVYEHRVLTANQLCTAFFNTEPRARLRLVHLYRNRLLDRFRPYEPNGSAPFHYVIDALGARLVASERGVEITDLGYSPGKMLAWANSSRLNHLIGVNDFFVSLLRIARLSGGRASLDEWWSERQCAKAMGGLVHPDGYGVWREGVSITEFCLEYDTGTESLERLRAKLNGYADLHKATGIRRWVLFVLHSEKREAGVRQVLEDPPVPVATANGCVDPANAVWLPLEPGASRRRLAELN